MANRIYIVEDSLVIAFHLKVMLEQEGYVIAGMAATGEKAKEDIENLAPDLVLLDVMLEGILDGVQLASHLKETTSIPFIYLTSLSDQESIQRIKVTEPYGYLHKPINNRDVLTVIEMALYRSQAEKLRKQKDSVTNSALNSTSTMVWSVDRNFNILMANEAFKHFIRENYRVEVIPNKRVLPEELENPEFSALRNYWTEKYIHALEGNPLRVHERIGDHYFDFSISPLWKDNQIAGVTVFAEDATDRVIKDLDLQECIKQLGELRLSAVRSAMNPHFIFNALNAIQYHIARQDRQKAMLHLSTFSKLVRGILINSGMEQISLHDELEMIKNYIALELLRFENKFTFNLNIDVKLPLEKIEIPSLIIQPYLENAILHGLSNRKGKGKLVLNISQHSQRLDIEIRDNGIGRREAEQLKRNQHKGDFSLSLGQDRVKRIEGQGSMNVYDLEDKKGKSAGTSVVISINLNKPGVRKPALISLG